jgi:hypothetical protein
MGFKSDKQRKGFFANQGNNSKTASFSARPLSSEEMKSKTCKFTGLPYKLSTSADSLQTQAKNFSDEELNQAIKTEVRGEQLSVLLKEINRRIKKETKLLQRRMDDYFKSVLTPLKLSGARYRVLAIRPNEKSSTVLGDFADKKLAQKNVELIKKAGGKSVTIVDTKKGKII